MDEIRGPQDDARRDLVRLMFHLMRRPSDHVVQDQFAAYLRHRAREAGFSPDEAQLDNLRNLLMHGGTVFTYSWDSVLEDIVTRAESIAREVSDEVTRGAVSAPRRRFDRFLNLTGYLLSHDARRVFEPVCEELREDYLKTRRERSRTARVWLALCFRYRAGRALIDCFLRDHIRLLATIGGVAALLWWLWLIGT